MFHWVRALTVMGSNEGEVGAENVIHGQTLTQLTSPVWWEQATPHLWPVLNVLRLRIHVYFYKVFLAL